MVRTVYSKRRYVLLGRSDKTVEELLDESNPSKGTFRAYYETKYGIKTLAPEEEMAEVMLMGSQFRCFLPLSLVVHEGYFITYYTLKKVVRRPLGSLERNCLCSDFIDDLLRPLWRKADLMAPLQVDTIAPLLTSRGGAYVKPHEVYERFEFVGDAVIKMLVTEAMCRYSILDGYAHPEREMLSEGDMSSLKSEFVSNAYLAAVGNHLCLPCYLWHPQRDRFACGTGQPLLDPLYGIVSPLNHDSATPFVASKISADVVEALVGYVFLHDGLSAAGRLLKVLRVINYDRDDPIFRTVVELYPPRGLKGLGLLEEAWLFRNLPFFSKHWKGVSLSEMSQQVLLLSAFTHPSYETNVPDYEVEKLGCCYIRLFVS